MSHMPLPFTFNQDAATEHQGPLNTKIEYTYHCARNFGTEGTIVVAGQASPEALQVIATKLYERECFLPKQVGIDSLTPDEDSDEYVAELDHPLHKFEVFSLTEEAPTVLLTFEQLFETFQGINSDFDWNFQKFGL
ncbi:hypothetical protein [Pseudomonas serbica]|jgi:hypothetical protein|uniref:hypothetical protein n=1 Tax=Pseudomonas serbica TaxID=2965074 RepID=UPI00237C3105|nr:hypothetical protein [Pseudomonas serbica]